MPIACLKIRTENILKKCHFYAINAKDWRKKLRFDMGGRAECELKRVWWVETKNIWVYRIKLKL